MRKRLHEKEYQQVDDFSEMSYVQSNRTPITKYILFCLLLVCLTAHFWISMVWSFISLEPFEKYEVLFLLYDLVIIHSVMIYFIFCQKRRAQFMDWKYDLWIFITFISLDSFLDFLVFIVILGVLFYLIFEYFLQLRYNHKWITSNNI